MFSAMRASSVWRSRNADKQFDMRRYPNRTHSIMGGITRVNVYSLFTSWLWENLYNAPAAEVIP